MASTTIGVKLDELLRARLRTAAERQGRTPHWLVKQAILAAVERIEAGESGPAPLAGQEGDSPVDPAEEPAASPPQPFLDFAQSVQPQSVLRARITAACRIPEPETVPLLLSGATLPREAA